MANTMTDSDEANKIEAGGTCSTDGIIMVCDVTDKESSNSVKDWTGVIDKHVSDGANMFCF